MFLKVIFFEEHIGIGWIYRGRGGAGWRYTKSSTEGSESGAGGHDRSICWDYDGIHSEGECLWQTACQMGWHSSKCASGLGLSARSWLSSFSFKNASSPMRIGRMYYHTWIFMSQRDMNCPMTLPSVTCEPLLSKSPLFILYIQVHEQLQPATVRNGGPRHGCGDGHGSACYWGTTSSDYFYHRSLRPARTSLSTVLDWGAFRVKNMGAVGNNKQDLYV